MSGPVSRVDTDGPTDVRVEGPLLETWTSRVADVGGQAVHRALPKRRHRTVGAWCFVDRVGPSDQPPRIGPHPHIGLHTVPWLFDGEIVHTDSLGTHQPIRRGQLNL